MTAALDGSHWQWNAKLVRDLEQKTGERFEFAYGTPVPLTVLNMGATVRHDDIIENLRAQLAPQLKSPCRMHSGQLAVGVNEGEQYRYPDLTIVCQPRDIRETQGGDTLMNPTVLFEVVSPGTRQTDYGDKREEYLRISSLLVYVVVEQEESRVTFYHRRDGRRVEASYIGGTHQLPGSTLSLDIDELYSRVTR